MPRRSEIATPRRNGGHDASARLSTRDRAAVAAIVVVLVCIGGLLPHVSSPIDRLINVKSNGAEPSYVNLRDDAPLRDAARIIPNNPTATYFLESNSTFGLDLYGAAVLYFPPAREVGDIRLAQWIVAYGVKPDIPATVRIVRRDRLGPNLVLVRIERR